MSDELFARLVRGEISESTYKNGGKPVELAKGVRVELKGEDLSTRHGILRKGMKGTVLGTYAISSNVWHVEWDENVGGHDQCGGKEGHVWNVNRYRLKII